MNLKLRNIAIAALLCIIGACMASAQTTQLKQTAAGPNCQVYGCINAPLSDLETFTFSDTLRYLYDQPINGKLAFRGLNYFMSGHSTGYLNIDLDASAYENNGFAVHELFHPSRGNGNWQNGYLQLDNEYVGSDPFLYGWNGAVNVASGTGQVGVVTANMIQDQTVNLTSGDPNLIQVPVQVTIKAGSLDADFTITATAPTAPPLGAPTPVTVTATFPDNTTATMTVTVGTIPASPPPEN